MSYQCLLTTFDNPFDPFEDFDSWYSFDVENGYDSCGRIARIANISDEMTENEITKEEERAIDLIIKHDVMNIFKKVTKQLKSYPEED